MDVSKATQYSGALSGMEAIQWSLQRLWSSKASSHLKCTIFDSILLDHNAVTTWLFTAKDGLVKSKSKKRKENVDEIVGHFQRTKSNADYNVPCMALLSGQSAFVTLNTAGEILGMLKSSPVSPIVLLIPNASMKGKLLLKVTYERPIESAISSSGFVDTSKIKVKSFLLSGSHPVTSIDFNTLSYIESKNPTYNSLSREFAMNLIKEMDSQSSKRVSKMTMFVYLSEEVSGEFARVNDANNYAIWLHHVSSLELSVVAKEKRVNDDHMSCVSSRLSTLDSSQTSYLKLWSLCMGDFCPLSRTNSKSYDVDDVPLDEFTPDHELTDGDIRIETRKAINRHRRIEDGGEENDEEASVAEQAQNLSQPIIPIKERTVMIKSILLAREEMQVLEEIDNKYTGNVISAIGSVNNIDAKIHMKAEIENTWPLYIARWWLSEGRRFQPAMPKVGKPPKPILSKTVQGDATDDPSQNKWFSWYYSQAKVCENCYFNYQQLELHRKKITKKLQRQAKLDSEEFKLTPEQRKQRDREIERRIFAQRKLATRLSKNKEVIEEKDEVVPSREQLLKSSSSSLLLPPVPWRHTTYHNFSNDTSTSSHILAKPVMKLRMSKDSNDDQLVEMKWENMRRQNYLAPLQILQTKSRKKQANPKTVNVTNYDAKRLLHPWQRQLDQLKREVRGQQNQGNEDYYEEDYSPPSSNDKLQKVPLQSIKEKSWRDVIPEEEHEMDLSDDDDMDGVGNLGWNPFVLNDLEP